jgi:AI-2 transport protein TqsA
MSSLDAARNRLLSLIAIILATEALRASYPVTIPVTFSALLIAAIWPVKLWFDHFVPKASYVCTSLILFLILSLFFAALYFSAA